MKQVVGTLFFNDGKLLIDKPRKRSTFQMVGGSVEEGESIYEGTLTGELSTSSEIESFMWFGVDDDTSILSNTLKNEIIPFCKEKKLIYKK